MGAADDSGRYHAVLFFYEFEFECARIEIFFHDLVSFLVCFYHYYNVVCDGL